MKTEGLARLAESGPQPSSGECRDSALRFQWMGAIVRFENTRYNRQEVMPQLGPAGQRRLSDSSVVSVGAGGVKSSLLYHLAAVGIGRLHVVDFDKVELSNLNRQILYRTEDIGRFKAEAAQDELRRLNPEITVTSSVARVSEANVGDLLGGYDVILEGGDGPEQRMMVNKYAVQSGTPMVHVSAQYAHGYVFTVSDSTDPCLECAFPDLPESRRGPVPVWGLATGMAGMMGANEVVKLLLGKGRLARGVLLSFSNFSNDYFSIPIAKDPKCPTCGHPPMIRD